jgi:hypothetical protein
MTQATKLCIDQEFILFYLQITSHSAIVSAHNLLADLLYTVLNVEIHSKS